MTLTNKSKERHDLQTRSKLQLFSFMKSPSPPVIDPGEVDDGCAGGGLAHGEGVGHRGRRGGVVEREGRCGRRRGAAVRGAVAVAGAAGRGSLGGGGGLRQKGSQGILLVPALDGGRREDVGEGASAPPQSASAAAVGPLTGGWAPHDGRGRVLARRGGGAWRRGPRGQSRTMAAR